MDLVHEDSAVEKKYIKRLMKHKKMESNVYDIQSMKKMRETRENLRVKKDQARLHHNYKRKWP